MRKIMIGAMLVLGSVCSFASISVSWTTGNFIYQSTGITTPLPVGSIAQLIWSADNLIDPIDPSNPLDPQGGEIRLASIGINNLGWFTTVDGIYNEADYEILDTNYFPGGYVYTRVFDFPTGGTPTGGTWYGEGGLVGPVANQHDIPTPTPIVCDITLPENFILNQQIAIPEPATWVLGFLGLSVVLIRRRLIRK